ncbi:general secretion pathway protein GspG [Enterobacter roggenkampii]|uniref:type II secretion system major pseudopilin GspG n=1 Tax=Enterobacter TaxID=547 RepID=UPI0005F8FD0F|nr:type II secretion system major pseudopilin GspG [Enterobacter mori]KJX01456.1 general secretion pathway protein GspG [Enterobacter roggenkampii]MCG5130310.1 type II secretion system major pseudopilin GspG [Enterobacter mori]
MKNTLLKKQQGFTLLELLVVLMIIALLAGFVGPKLFTQVDNAKEKTALSQMKGFSDALSQYRLDVGQYPDEQQGLKALMEKPSQADNWHGPYLSKAIPNDPWGNPYQWHNPARTKDTMNDVEITATGNNDHPVIYGF